MYEMIYPITILKFQKVRLDNLLQIGLSRIALVDWGDTRGSDALVISTVGPSRGRRDGPADRLVVLTLHAAVPRSENCRAKKLFSENL